MKILFKIACFVIITNHCISQNTGIFPPEPFNGMQVNYSITGATISKYNDKPGFTWSRNLVMSEVAATGKLGISGTLQAGGYSATVKIVITADNVSVDSTMEVFPNKPGSFNLSINIPKKTKYASISINMHGHYSMGGGSRYVVVQASYGQYGAEFENIDPNQGKPAPSKVAAEKLLKEWLDNVYKNKTDKGVLLGPLNNLASWFDPQEYEKYACGAYQGKILDLLDQEKRNPNSKYKAIFDHFDYGPIQYGPLIGEHHCVAVFPKGEDWKTTATVLDPWINGKPETYTIDEHKNKFKFPVQGAHWLYDKMYPTTGTGYDTQGYEKKPHKEDMNRWFNTLSPYDQKQITKDHANKVFYINEAYKKSQKNTQQKQQNGITAHCYLYMYIVDDKGKISGFMDGKLRNEIEGIHVNAMKLDDQSYWTEIIYPENKDLKIIMKGFENGDAAVYSTSNLSLEPSKRSVLKYELNFVKDQEFVLDPSSDKLPIQNNSPVSGGNRYIFGKNITIGEILSDVNKIPDEMTKSGEDKNSDSNVEINFLENLNEYSSRTNPSIPLQLKLENAVKITKIQNFHTNVANGSSLKIKLISAKGQIYGPWAAKKVFFEGFEQYECWQVVPNILLPPGVYTIIDSEPSTWLTNTQSNNRGFSRIIGIKK